MISFTGDDIPASATEDITDPGHLNMTTISVTDDMPLFEALGMWATGRYALAPREDYFPPDKTVEQVKEQDAQAFRDSQSAAEIAALRYLGLPEGHLRRRDPGRIAERRRAASRRTRSSTSTAPRSPTSPHCRPRSPARTPGQVVAVTVLRDGENDHREGHPGQPTRRSAARAFLGIGAVERPVAPFTTAIALERIGGPSAGLMFTLGIIDKLTDGDLTGGQFIAGTGTIDPAGAVGPIGGVLLKLITAREAGATVFLVPADNCAEAVTQVRRVCSWSRWRRWTRR